MAKKTSQQHFKAAVRALANARHALMEETERDTPVPGKRNCYWDFSTENNEWWDIVQMESDILQLARHLEEKYYKAKVAP